MKKIWTVAMAVAIASATIPFTANASAGQAQIQSSVSFRTSPNTSSQVKYYLKSGEQVQVLEQVNSYWYKVQDSTGEIGYISSNAKYIGAVSAPPADSVAGKQATAFVKSSVSFRTGASTSSPRIRFLKTGETVQIASQPNSYWYEVVDASGTRGYISSSSEFITVNGGAGQTPGGNGTQKPQQPAKNGSYEKAIAAGMKYLGTPYQFGSNRDSTATFDCSSFVRRAFLDGLNLQLPADSRQQGDYVKKVGKTSKSWSSLKRGDLMFFMDYKGTSKASYNGINKSTAKITHVGIYLGNGQILHTYSKASGGVRTDSIQGKHWEYRFLFGGSVS